MKDNKHYVRRFREKIFQPVDNSPLIIFRIVFGFLLFLQVTGSLLNGTIYRNFIEPPFSFSFIGFEFLQPLPGNGMYYYTWLMAVLALMIMLGAWYRLAMTGFAILWTLLYLMQKAGYNNHYYLILLVCWLMTVVPANVYYAVDSWRKPVTRKPTCPQWATWIFAAQFAIVYFFAAISKLNVDWFSGKFLSIQFSRLSIHHVYGSVYGQEWFPVFIAYTGFFFDLLIVPLLAWKKTRNWAFLFSCLFHLFNSFSFGIGIFPFMAIALSVFFFEPEKIRCIFFRNKAATIVVEDHMIDPAKRRLVVYGLIVYFIIQVILPMRPWFFPGNVFWTEEGYRMSWKMMMRTKSGTVYFRIVDPGSGKIWINDPKNYFSLNHIMWLSISPDITWQYAQRLKREFRSKGFPDVKIYAIGSVSLNRNKAVPLVDTAVDLASVKWDHFRHSPWITSN
jgi:hypothetical protein